MYGKGSKLHQGTKLYKDDFAPRVYFAQLTFLQRVKNTEKKNNKKIIKLNY